MAEAARARASTPATPARATPGAGPQTVRVGVRRRPLTDLYHLLLTSPWWVLFTLIVASYLVTNAGFAAIYSLDEGGIENVRPGHFSDAYFFSVQTMATIGYGKMVPVSTFANAVVAIEALFGLVSLALATGLMFAKFSQPRARVLFSRYAVVSHRDGVRSLMVRLANERATGLVEAQLRLVLVRDETTQEGESVRRFHPLALSRASTAVFALSWTAVHPLTESSPLYGLSKETLVASEAVLVASLVGIEEASGQTVHARYTWTAAEVLIDRRFKDVLRASDDGRRVLDYTAFHEVEPVPPVPPK